jgi:predicted nucleotidyltransferase
MARLRYHGPVVMAEPDEKLRATAVVAGRHAGLSLLVLFGSRAPGGHGHRSDWDLGYLGEDRFDADALLADLVTVLGTDRVDLVNLRSASGLLRFRAARDGRPVLDATGDAFERFWLEAVTFRCDAAPVLERGYATTLAGLGS